MRLILQDGDQKRALRLNTGNWTIGSAEDCAVTLQSKGVLDHHCELQVDGDTVTLSPLDSSEGVLVGGAAIDGPTPVPHNTLIAVGQARMKVDLRKQAEANVAAAPAASPAASGAGSASTRRRPSGAGGGSGGGRVQRGSRRQAKKSLPTWLILLLAVPAVGIAIYMFKGVASSTMDEGFSLKTSRIRIEQSLEVGDVTGAREVLADVDRYAKDNPLSEEWAPVFAGFQKELDELTNVSETMMDESAGNKAFTRIDKFAKAKLQRNERPAAREFMRRSDAFMASFPRHSKVEWMQRMQAQYGPFAKMEEPNTLDDLMFQLRYLTEGTPRDYMEARALIKEFEDRSGPGHETLTEFKKALPTSEKEFFEKEIGLAESFWKRDNKSKALQSTLIVLSAMSNEEYASKCVDFLKKMGPAVDEAMTSIANDRRQDYLITKSKRHSEFVEFLKKRGLE